MQHNLKMMCTFSLPIYHSHQLHTSLLSSWKLPLARTNVISSLIVFRNRYRPPCKEVDKTFLGNCKVLFCLCWFSLKSKLVVHHMFGMIYIYTNKHRSIGSKLIEKTFHGCPDHWPKLNAQLLSNNLCHPVVWERVWLGV